MHDLDSHAQRLRTQGYTVIKGVLDAEQLRQAREALDEVFRHEEPMARSRGWKNEVYQVAYMLPQKHPHFRRFGLNPRLYPLMQELLGRECVMASLNGLTMTPGGKPQGLHIDQWETVPGAVLYINALHCLDDFRKENGCTRLVPGSQDRPFPGRDKMAALESEALQVEAEAGSVIAYNGGVWHAGSQNRTDQPRRAIHAYYSRSWVRPQWDFPKSISPEVAAELAEDEKRLFGFYAQPGWYDWQADRQVRAR
ncbi:MAG: phytanoyl-CoA dioxygenase family protein [Planctomycetota bacterium]|nr:phytanoyl-CoA dioxygenase family protein [Planctomycetota bacterium]